MDLTKRQFWRFRNLINQNGLIGPLEAASVLPIRVPAVEVVAVVDVFELSAVEKR